MSFGFNVEEILEIAERIERNGARFYQRAAELMGDEEAANLLLDLAAWEHRHERVFASMKKDLSEAERQPEVFDPDSETSLYLRAMADGHVFDAKVDSAALLTGRESKEDVLRLAIAQEKDSIIFYLGMKEMIPQAAGRGKIDEIIKEEMGHIGFLNREIGVSRQNST